jgi:hypothetical protein
MLRQDGRCADCGTRLIMGSLCSTVKADDANRPERLAGDLLDRRPAKTPNDLKEIAKAKRLADEHQDFVVGQEDKVGGGEPSRKQRSLRRRCSGDDRL